MRDIQRAGGHGWLDKDDVDRAVNGLHGRYLTADLYARYSDAAKEAGRLPAHPVAFGQELAAREFKRVRISVEGRQQNGWEAIPTPRLP